MTDNVENLILEMLKARRNEVKALGVKMDEQFESVRLRLGSMESHLAGLQREVAGIHADVAIVHGRMDKLETRLDRIERRLELRDLTV
jgi:predicted  nucleic acid-binding Zn-ribbon protein